MNLYQCILVLNISKMLLVYLFIVGVFVYVSATLKNISWRGNWNRLRHYKSTSIEIVVCYDINQI